MTDAAESRLPRTDRLIAEVLHFLPQYTSRRGSFNSLPGSGFSGRNPASWQSEFLETLDVALLRAFRPDTSDVVRLTEVVNMWNTPSLPQHYVRWDGAQVLLPTATLATVLGYALLEMLIRRLIPGGALETSSLDRLLLRLEQEAPLRQLGSDFQALNAQMTYSDSGGSVTLYARVKKGRDQLLHGNVLRSHEGEGLLLSPLIDLILLHVMKKELESAHQSSG